MRFLQSWRWFGPNDPVTLTDIRQTGATGIVTALHHVPHGEVWSVDDIKKRQDEIRSAGRRFVGTPAAPLEWAVIESLTVHESIKTRSGPYRRYVENYIQSLRNVAACGLRVVTYNFMPVNDWTRTNLDYVMPDGARALYFNWFDLAVFDMFLLRRPNAADNYPAHVAAEAERRFAAYSDAERDHLAGVVMFGIPGEEAQTIPKMREKLALYAEIDHDALQSNLVEFLREIAPVADDLGLQLAIHPDDPPFDILGLPRVVHRPSDYEHLIRSVPNLSNGVCFCTGSLGASPENDVVAMAETLAERTYFAHLRNVKKDEHGNFFEDAHLAGDVDMYAVMRILLREQQRRGAPIPFRPDHGHQMLDDLGKTTNPGYSCLGRMRGLAELRGLELGICKAEGWE